MAHLRRHPGSETLAQARHRGQVRARVPVPREHCQGAARPAVRGWAGASTPAGARAHPAPRLADRSALAGGALSLPGTGRTARADARARGVPEFLVGGAQRFVRRAGPGAGDAGGQDTLADRMEEHTSELQSLMRISYADFCLKKKKKTIKQT